MTHPPRPTDVELKLLRILWDLGPATVKDVHGVLVRTQDYTYTGVLRMLQVMFEKGLVTRDESARSHVYRAAHSRDSMERGMVADLVDRLFGGSASDLVLAALATRKVNARDKAKIQELLGIASPGTREEARAPGAPPKPEKSR